MVVNIMLCIISLGAVFFIQLPFKLARIVDAIGGSNKSFVMQNGHHTIKG